MVYDICIISPPHFKQCMPNQENTGSIEQYCYALAEEFARLGKRVILWGNGNAPKDKNFTLGYYFNSCPNNYYNLSPQIVTNHEIIHVSKCLQNVKAKYYLNHCISGIPLLEMLRNKKRVHLNTTLHWNIEEARIGDYIRAFPEHNYITISKHQTKQLQVKFKNYIHPGIDTSDWHKEIKKEDYLLFLGRIMPCKGPDLAVEVARQTRNKMYIAGRKMDERFPDYFNTKIEPFLGSDIRYLGEICGESKKRIIQKAKCVLCLGRWAEPFGLVMLEAALSGTPVIAWNPGSENEVIKHNINGFIINKIDEDKVVKKALLYLNKIDLLDINKSYKELKEEYDITRSAEKYLNIYKQS